jgi:hypothetical protein
MTNEEAIKIIRNEYLCVDKDCDIEKSCRKCPYAMPTKEPILEAYNMAIKALEQEPMYEDKGVLEQLSEKQNNLSATNKAWSDAIEKNGYVN